MGTWRSLRVAFILGSLFMVLLIIVYWDDIGGFNLYPLQGTKHDSLNSGFFSPTTTSPSHSTSASRARARVSFGLLPTAASKTLIHDEPGISAEEHAEDKQGDAHEQSKEETKQGTEEERSCSGADVEQEVRKKRIIDMCSGKDAAEFPGRTRPFEQIPNRELDHLIVDDTHQIIYCYVPKVRLLCVCLCIVFV